MKKNILIFYILLLSLGLASCGTTKIVTDRNLNADIYINNVNMGRKSVEINRTGPPKKIMITAKYNGLTIGSIEQRRKFELSTCLIGYFTYGIGLLTAWRYPEIIIIPTIPQENDGISPWDMPQKSKWMDAH